MQPGLPEWGEACQQGRLCPGLPPGAGGEPLKPVSTARTPPLTAAGPVLPPCLHEPVRGAPDKAPMTTAQDFSLRSVARGTVLPQGLSTVPGSQQAPFVSRPGGLSAPIRGRAEITSRSLGALVPGLSHMLDKSLLS